MSFDVINLRSEGRKKAILNQKLLSFYFFLVILSKTASFPLVGLVRRNTGIFTRAQRTEILGLGELPKVFYFRGFIFFFTLTKKVLSGTKFS